MLKTAKIKKVVQEKEYSGAFGKFYYVTVEMENGDKGTISRKTEKAVSEGTELTYTLGEKNGYAVLNEPKTPRIYTKSQQSEAVVALNAAVNFASSLSTTKNHPIADWSPHILALADQFHHWLKNK